MPNELLWVLLLLFNFSAITSAYWRFGRYGLFVWVGMATVIANIQVIKTVGLFGYAASVGNIIYATTFLTTDILSEIYGKKEARKAVWVSFFTLISATTMLSITLRFIPHVTDFAQPALETIFTLLPRIAVGSLLAFIVSQRHDVWAYEIWKKRFPKPNQIWIRNNLSTMVSQLIDTCIFVSIAFVGVMPNQIIVEIAVTTYLFKWVVAASDTPFVYLAVYLKKKGVIPE
tara:strand:- start:113 stop:802 length:690 start_codon:yes stop_codon:yes gene_type:complete